MEPWCLGAPGDRLWFAHRFDVEPAAVVLGAAVDAHPVPGAEAASIATAEAESRRVS